MTTPPSFPSLRGQGWSVKKTPTFSTRVASHVSGREVRSPLYLNPIWNFELTFDGLDSGAVDRGLGANSLQTLMNLFMVCQGQYGTFLFTDPSDCATVGAWQWLATGDSSTTTFTFARQLLPYGFFEPVGWVTNVAHVYLAGVDQPSGWSLTTPNSLVFNSPPANGAAIAANFSYAFVCRFDDDSADFEEFMQNLWELKTLKLRSVRAA